MNAGGWLESLILRAGKGVLRLKPQTMVAPGLFSTKPTAGLDFVGALARDANGTWVCQPDGVGGYAWYQAGPSSGNVFGQSSSVDGEMALFSGTGGKTIKRATGSGIVKATSGVYSTVTAPSGVIVGDTDTQTLSGKTLTTPTISSTGFANANHAHTASTSGGVLGMASQGILRTYQAANYTGTNVNTAQKVFNASTNGAVDVAASTVYEMEAVYHIHTTGTTSHRISTLFGGTATITSIGYRLTDSQVATEVGATEASLWVAAATASGQIYAAVATATHHNLTIRGQVQINAAGTFIPQYQWSAAPGVAGLTLANSWFRLTPVSSATIGTWS